MSFLSYVNSLEVHLELLLHLSLIHLELCKIYQFLEKAIKLFYPRMHCRLPFHLFVFYSLK